MAVAEPLEFLHEQVRSGLERSYCELTALDMTLAAMNEVERAYILELAQQNDAPALQVIFRTMVADPQRGERLLTITCHVRQELIKATCGARNELARQSFLMKTEMVEASLLSEASASPLERLLIERVATCWLAAELADMHDAKQEEYHSPGQHDDYYGKRQDRAHRRFLQAVDALTRMRRLMSPVPLAAGQVNIAASGSQQLNAVIMREAR